MCDKKEIHPLTQKTVTATTFLHFEKTCALSKSSLENAYVLQNENKIVAVTYSVFCVTMILRQTQNLSKSTIYNFTISESIFNCFRCFEITFDKTNRLVKQSRQ